MPTLSSMPLITAYTNEDWNLEPFAFTTNGLADDFTGASAKMGLRLAGSTTNAVEFTTAASTLAITLPNEIGVTAPLALVSTLAAGLYNWDLVVTYGSGDIETILSGQLQVVAGTS